MRSRKVFDAVKQKAASVVAIPKAGVLDLHQPSYLAVLTARSKRLKLLFEAAMRATTSHVVYDFV